MPIIEDDFPSFSGNSSSISPSCASPPSSLPSILAATSGGDDSTALLLLLVDARRRNYIGQLGAFYLDHQIRVGAGDKEKAFLKELCQSLNVTFFSDIADIPRSMKKGDSLEEVARDIRYERLEIQRNNGNFDLIATGHIQDDQAETILLRLIRGAGPRGLAGILPISGHVIRPILDLNKKDIRKILDSFGLICPQDITNLDPAFDRNKLRHQVMPHLEKAFPGAKKALAHTGAIQSQISGFIDHMGDMAFSQIVQKRDNGFAMDPVEFSKLPDPIKESLLKKMGDKLSLKYLNRRHISQMMEFPQSRTGKKLVLPNNYRFIKTFDEILFFQEKNHDSPDFIELYPDSCAFLSSWRINCQKINQENHQENSQKMGQIVECESSISSENTIYLSPKTSFPLIIRFWQKGDKIKPVGLGGTKKLSDIFTDKKVPAHLRKRIPLIQERQGQILMVSGIIRKDGLEKPKQGFIYKISALKL